MPTAAERQAIAFLATVAVLGGGVRMLRASAFERALDRADSARQESLARADDGPASRPADARAFERQRAAVDSARAARRNRSARRSSRSGASAGAGRELVAPVDPDVASADELERLPRIGPALAARIVADRDSLGPFGSLEALQRVRGIGPALARGLAPHVTFSSGLRPLHGESRRTRPP